jgi:hypothetical protein
VSGIALQAITLWRPWTWAIVHAGKDVENRGWPPPKRLVGSYIAIHAGKRWDDDAVFALREYQGVQVPIGAEEHQVGVVAIARIAGVIPPQGEPGVSRWWASGAFGWKLADVVPIPAVVCNGRQGLWLLPDHVATQVRERYVAARAAMRVAL